MVDRSEILPKLIGKKIKGIVIAADDLNHPKGQIFLIFSDNTYYEFYTWAKISSRSDFDEGGLEEVINWIKGSSTRRIIFQTCDDSIDN